PSSDPRRRKASKPSWSKGSRNPETRKTDSDSTWDSSELSAEIRTAHLTFLRRPAQEVDDQVCRRLRLLFRDPVPAIRDDHIFDVVGDTPHNRADHGAECSFATEGQDRHLKLALRKERPVVGRILAERQELGKAGSHSAGLRIERRIMLALRFIKPLLVPGKFVPEAVEIDALAAGDQALHVRTPEAKVPHGRILCDLIPGSDAGQRRVDRYPSAHALGVGGGNCE